MDGTGLGIQQISWGTAVLDLERDKRQLYFFYFFIFLQHLSAGIKDMCPRARD
ncbi:rCG60785, partial [Rattus norvegicus]